jgi:hypothetical protein
LICNTDQVLKGFIVFATIVFRTAPTTFQNKGHLLYFFLAASLITTFVQIIIEAVMVTRYNNGGSQQWLSGCEILSACSMEQGPASAMSQIYNEVENMMKIVVIEIVVNVLSLVLMAASTCQIYREMLQSAGSSSSRTAVILFVNVFEMLLEIGQVACSALALKYMDGSIKPVNELFSSLVGKSSENAGLCVLPCCGSSSGNQITC